MLSWFPRLGANKAFWRLMSAVLAWPIACGLGLGLLGQVSGVMHCYGCRIPCLGNIGILPCPPHLRDLRTPEPSRSESLFGCILQTYGGHKIESDLLIFKAMTLALDLPPLSPSTKYLF